MSITLAIATIVLLDLALLVGLAAAMRSAYTRLAPPPGDRARTEATVHPTPHPVRRGIDSRRPARRVPA
jgi:hypothetical protein